MGAEPPLPNNTHAPIILGLQPAALIDNVAPVDSSLLDQIPGERGGSIPWSHLSRLRMKKGSTAQVIAQCARLSSAVKVQADELTREDFKGSKVIQAAILIAKQEGLSVSLDLASFEMVRNYRAPLLQLLESGDIDLCFANEDEAKELLRGESKADPEAAVEVMAKYCQWAVVRLGPNGCIAKHGKEVVRVPAIRQAKATDATGAGDRFATGFLYGLVKGLSLEQCCKAGSCSGGSVIHSCSWW